DGIRCRNVTGVQTCALPIYLMAGVRIPGDFLERVDIFWIAAVMFSILFALGSVFFYNHEILVRIKMEKTAGAAALAVTAAALVRSEERRVGKEGRSRGGRER